jgi:hypothetical protein
MMGRSGPDAVRARGCTTASESSHAGRQMVCVRYVFLGDVRRPSILGATAVWLRRLLAVREDLAPICFWTMRLNAVLV